MLLFVYCANSRGAFVFLELSILGTRSMHEWQYVLTGWCFEHGFWVVLHCRVRLKNDGYSLGTAVWNSSQSQQ